MSVNEFVPTAAGSVNNAAPAAKQGGCGSGSCGCKSQNVKDNTVGYADFIAKKPTASLFPVRDNEPAYALLNDPVTQGASHMLGALRAVGQTSPPTAICHHPPKGAVSRPTRTQEPQQREARVSARGRSEGMDVLPEGL